MLGFMTLVHLHQWFSTFFDWPNGSIWSNIIADPIVGGLALLWGIRKYIHHSEKLHKEKLEQAETHHQEKLDQDRQYHLNQMRKLDAMHREVKANAGK